MSWMKTISLALIASLLPYAALAAPSAAHIHRHHHHPVFVNPGPVWDLYAPNWLPSYDYYGGPAVGGELYSPDSGGVNSMSNDFGTSGSLGHTNGMPAIGH